MKATTPEEPRKTILIVDDSDTDLRLLTKILSADGHNVWPLSSGRVALSQAKINHPDLILLDIDMPNLTGYELCNQLKASALTEDIPVIFVSAFEGLSEKMRAFSTGAVDYITKPFQVTEVQARVRVHLTWYEKQKALRQENEWLHQELRGRRSSALATPGWKVAS